MVPLVRATLDARAALVLHCTAPLDCMSAGKRGKRHSMPNSRIMIHQPLGGASGQAVDIEIQAKEIMYHKVNLPTQHNTPASNQPPPNTNTVPLCVMRHACLCVRAHACVSVWSQHCSGRPFQSPALPLPCCTALHACSAPMTPHASSVHCCATPPPLNAHTTGQPEPHHG